MLNTKHGFSTNTYPVPIATERPVQNVRRFQPIRSAIEGTIPTLPPTLQ